MNDELSNMFEKLNIDKNQISPDMINNLMNTINNSSNNSNNFDFDTILKIKSIIDKMNIKDDPRSRLLESLKPYLRKSRRNKIDQYVQLMNMSTVINLFNGENNNASR